MGRWPASHRPDSQPFLLLLAGWTLLRMLSCWKNLATKFLGTGTSLWPSGSTMKPFRFSCIYSSGGKCLYFFSTFFFGREGKYMETQLVMFSWHFLPHCLVSVSFLPQFLLMFSVLSAQKLSWWHRSNRGKRKWNLGAVDQHYKTFASVWLQDQSFWDDWSPQISQLSLMSSPLS